MRLCSIRHADGVHAALVVAEDEVVDLTALALATGSGPTSVLGWVELGAEGLERLADLSAGQVPAGVRGPLSRADLVMPLDGLSRNVICVGANYPAHIEESEVVVGPLGLPPEPVYFTKDSRSLCGPYDDIEWDPQATSQLDWEVELAVVVGRPGRNLDPAVALDHVWGYTILNDVSARDVQLGRDQWWKGKSLQGTSPLGPFLVSADEVGQVENLTLRTWVDGVEKQSASASQMIHGVAALLADLSTTLTLAAGDVIATGTPAGVGMAAVPPEWLTDGRVVETEIRGLGRQRNVVVTRRETHDG